MAPSYNIKWNYSERGVSASQSIRIIITNYTLYMSWLKTELGQCRRSSGHCWHWPLPFGSVNTDPPIWACCNVGHRPANIDIAQSSLTNVFMCIFQRTLNKDLRYLNNYVLCDAEIILKLTQLPDFSASLLPLDSSGKIDRASHWRFILYSFLSLFQKVNCHLISSKTNCYSTRIYCLFSFIAQPSSLKIIVQYTLFHEFITDISSWVVVTITSPCRQITFQ
jgi:hypothetical protein